MQIISVQARIDPARRQTQQGVMRSDSMRIGLGRNRCPVCDRKATSRIRVVLEDDQGTQHVENICVGLHAEIFTHRYVESAGKVRDSLGKGKSATCDNCDGDAQGGIWISSLLDGGTPVDGRLGRKPDETGLPRTVVFCLDCFIKRIGFFAEKHGGKGLEWLED